MVVVVAAVEECDVELEQLVLVDNNIGDGGLRHYRHLRRLLAVVTAAAAWQRRRAPAAGSGRGGDDGSLRYHHACGHCRRDRVCLLPSCWIIRDLASSINEGILLVASRAVQGNIYRMLTLLARTCVCVHACER